MLTCAAAAAVMSLSSAQAQFVYNDYSQYNSDTFAITNGQEIGNEITVAPGSFFSLTSFSIEYYSPTTLSSTVAMDVRFYLNDGVPTNGFPTPDSLIFDSGWYNDPGNGGLPGIESGNGYHIVTFASPDFSSGVVPLTSLLPGNFTFSITWTNLNDANQIEMPLATTTPGISYGDYWLVNNSGQWALMFNRATDGNLLVDIEAQNTTPPGISSVSYDGVSTLSMQIGPTVVGNDYIIQTCSDLTTQVWTSVSTNAGTGGLIPAHFTVDTEYTGGILSVPDPVRKREFGLVSEARLPGGGLFVDYRIGAPGTAPARWNSSLCSPSPATLVLSASFSESALPALPRPSIVFHRETA